MRENVMPPELESSGDDAAYCAHVRRGIYVVATQSFMHTPELELVVGSDTTSVVIRGAYILVAVDAERGRAYVCGGLRLARDFPPPPLPCRMTSSCG